jgi:hypothetical protein
MHRFIYVVWLGLFGLALAAGAEEGTPAPPPAPIANLPHWLELGGQLRGRFEAPSGHDSYLSRIRLDLGLRPTNWLRFYVQAQDARGTSGTPYDPVDLRQGYVELHFEGEVSARFRAGRQELAFGGERMIGPSDWGISRTFDALDLSVTRGAVTLDLFAASPIQIDPTRFDRHKPGEHVYGAYATIRNRHGMQIEPYLMFRPNGLASPGLRVTGRLPRGFDYSGETVIQHGGPAAGRAATGTLGWTIGSAAWKPRISAEYNYGSSHFDPLYPSNHNYYGMIDRFGWKDLRNYRVGFDFVAARKLKVRADFNDFAHASSAHIGREINTVAAYQWTKVWKFGAGIAHLFPGYTYPYVMFAGTL